MVSPARSRVCACRCDGEDAKPKTNPTMYRDKCAEGGGEVAWLRGSPEDEEYARRPGPSGQYHLRPAHYETRDAICKCLLADWKERKQLRLGEALASCVADGGPPPGFTPKDEL